MKDAPRVCVVGSSMFDEICRAPCLPGPGETRVGSSVSTGFGGKGSNQAVAAARLGARVTLVAKLGQDAIGRETLRHFEEERIETEAILLDASLTSGRALIWVQEDTGENRILILPGANQALTPGDVRRADRAIAGAQVVLCQMETPTDCTLEAFCIAKRARSVLTVLNPAPCSPVSEELLRITDLLVPNESEAASLTQIPISNSRDAERAAYLLRAQGARSVIITLGSEGALALPESGQPFLVTAPVVKAVDTTGAGDCFIGSLGYFLASGLHLRTAMERACQIASRSVLLPGAQAAFPKRSDLDPSLFTVESEADRRSSG